ncbi:MAG: hypothetical protein WBF37_11495 [Dehalococcoidia bacterium]
MAKPGPKTEAGKAVVRLNAVEHGVLSTTPVIPGLEREEDWEEHRAGVLASLAPEGHMEMALAERVALQLWRLQRVVRYEREVVAVAQEEVDDDLAQERRYRVGEPESVEQARNDLSAAQDHLRSLESLAKMPDGASLSGDDATTILDSLADSVGVDLDEDDVPLPDVLQEADWDAFDSWTAGLVREVIDGIAAHAETEDLLAAAVEQARTSVPIKKDQLNRLVAELDRMRRQRLLPDGETLQKLVRYEAHLNRQLYQALHELEALQARRQGEPAPLARVDVQGIVES